MIRLRTQAYASLRKTARTPGARALTGSADSTARFWEIFPTTQSLIDRVKASVPRCLTPAQRESFHLGGPAPRWCHTRNLWPYADHGPPYTPGADPPYGPPPETWEERLTAVWDRVTGEWR